uniref:GNAT family N-acetyltransferase n=1 Tax=Paracidovorax oryzae TaxID=862720 RepID=UPI0003792EFA
MAFVEPVILQDRGIRLEPLALTHEAGLAAAAADGQLWTLRVTSVPEPANTRAYIEAALEGRAQGHRFAFAVTEEASGEVLGTTSYHDILPAVKRVEIGWGGGGRRGQ